MWRIHMNIIKLRELLLKMKSEATGITTGFVESLQTEKLADELDIAQVDLSNALAGKLQSRKKSYLSRIDMCLKKIEDGTYGDCNHCGERIAEKRLLARPTALLCIDCKLEQEKFENREKSASRGFLSDLD